MKASTVNKFNSFFHLPMFLIFTVFGIVFLVISFSILNQKIPENYVETTAEIVHIEELCDIDDEYYHKVYISYTYNGETYNNKEYNIYNSSMTEGYKVKVFVNPENPDEFLSDGSNSFIFILVSGLFTAIGLIGTVYNVKKFIKNKRRVEDDYV